MRCLPPFFKRQHCIVYSRQENVNEVGEIQHPSVRETLRHLEIDCGVTIHHDGDIPALSGTGTSSAFTVGLLNGLRALDGHIRIPVKSDFDGSKVVVYQPTDFDGVLERRAGLV